MTDTIHTTDGNNGKGTGFFLGSIVLILFAAVFIFYGLPAMQRGTQAPADRGMQIPNEIDVNVNQPEK